MGQREALHFERPAQFFSYAARAMRHLLTNRARDRLRLRAGGQWMKVTLDEDDLRLALDTASQALALDAALDALEQADTRAAQVVELRRPISTTVRPPR
jgi:DNA-directed RNA polymerase specialized sigma24 family protein